MVIYLANKRTSAEAKEIADEATVYYWQLSNENKRILLEVTKRLYECQTVQDKG